MLTSLLAIAAVAGPYEDAMLQHRVNRPVMQLAQAGESQVRSGGRVLDPLATIDLADRAEISVSQSGVIASDVPQEGEQVSKGQMIVKLDDEVPQAALRVAEITADSNIDEELARKYYEVARTEFNQARQANERVADAVSALELERLRLTAERSRLDIFKAQHEQDVAIAREEEAREVVETYSVDAPFDGVVAKRLKRRGEAVRPGDPIIELISIDRVYVQADVPVKLLPSVKVGTKVHVFEDYGDDYDRPDLNEPLIGTVLLILPSGSANKFSVKATIEVVNTDSRLLPGLSARVVLPD